MSGLLPGRSPHSYHAIASEGPHTPPLPDHGADSAQDHSQKSHSSLDDAATYVSSSHSRLKQQGQASRHSTRSTDGKGSFRKHRPKSSGGFLLDSAFETFQQHKSGNNENGHSNIRDGEDAKGGIMNRMGNWRRKRGAKSKPEDSSTISNVTADTSTRAEHLGSLSIETTQPPGTSYDHPPPNIKDRPQRTQTDARTLGDDPLQIVNLALGLSENRRRVSGRSQRTFSARPNSSLLGDPFQTSSAGGSLKQHINGQRYSSQSRQASSHPPTFQLPSRPVTSSADSDKPTTLLILDKGQEVPLVPSDATLARAEKAKTNLELAFHYRRLLQYLPRLQQPQSRPSSRRRFSTSSSPPSSVPLSRVGSRTQNPEELGRVYNPLQCIRNRMVRARERKPINAKAQGWNNLEAVSAWIDIVERESLSSTFMTGSAASLPIYHSAEGSADEPTRSPRDSFSQQGAYKRPRMDWMTDYSEFLADAYWLERNGNKRLIEDRDWNKIAPASVDLQKSVGQRSEFREIGEHLPLDVGKRTVAVLDAKLVSEGRKQSHTNQTGRSHSTRGILRQHSSQEYEKTNGRLRAARAQSTSSSGSNSAHQQLPQTSTKAHNPHTEREQTTAPDSLDSRILEKQMIEMLKKESNEGDWGTPGEIAIESFEFPRKQSITNAERRKEGSSSRKHSKESTKNDSASSSLRRIGESLPHFKRSSISSDRFRKSKLSVDELDITAPSSPDPGRTIERSKSFLGDLTPSISLNLSSPSSREVSPTRKPRPRPLGAPFLPNKVERDAEGGDVSETDFAADDQALVSSEISSQPTFSPHSVNGEDQKKFLNKAGSPDSEEKASKSHKRSDSRWRRSEREDKDTETSRIRGIFKGGRIEEIVKSEVSRVGDFIWKKEPPAASRQSSPTSSATSEASISEDETSYDTTREELSRSSTRNKPEELATASSRPRYLLPNLPSFRSPFGPPLADPKLVAEPDHISRQQSQRERQRSPRFDRLAPPKLRLQGPLESSGDIKKPESRRKSAAPRIEKRKSSYAANDRQTDPQKGVSLQNVQKADSRLNEMLREDIIYAPGAPGGLAGRVGLPVTALSAFGASEMRRSSHDSRSSPQRQCSLSERPAYDTGAPASRREVARVKALLVCSGVKAQEIQRLSAERRPLQPLTLRNRLTISLPKVSRLQQHQYSARLVEHDIDLSARLFETTAAHLRNVVISDLYDRIKMVQDRFNSKLMPMARASGDDADAFNTELTSTHTLAIKQLNDSVYTMARRRRRRLKWISRLGFVMLEWALLGIMWWVWLVFVVVRLLRGTVRGAFSAVRWLFWF